MIRNTKLYCVVVPFMLGIPEVLNLHYIWSSTDQRFDCVVGISFVGMPVSTGVFINSHTVLTSANPIERYLKDEKDPENLRIHFIQEEKPGRVVSWSRSTCWSTSPLHPNKRKTKIGDPDFWVPMNGEDQSAAESHSPLHDLYTLAVTFNEKVDTLWKFHFLLEDRTKAEVHRYLVADITRNYTINKKRLRRPFSARLPFLRSTITNNHFMYGGFDNNWVNPEAENKSLHIEYYGKHDVLLDCSEYLLRTWGAFICIENKNNFPTISGAPLFNKGVLIGIGAFGMRFGEEYIHVFTDLRPYFDEKHMITYNQEFKGLWFAHCGHFKHKSDTGKYQWDLKYKKFNAYMLSFRKIKRLAY